MGRMGRRAGNPVRLLVAGALLCLGRTPVSEVTSPTKGGGSHPTTARSHMSNHLQLMAAADSADRSNGKLSDANRCQQSFFVESIIRALTQPV